MYLKDAQLCIVSSFAHMKIKPQNRILLPQLLLAVCIMVDDTATTTIASILNIQTVFYLNVSLQLSIIILHWIKEQTHTSQCVIALHRKLYLILKIVKLKLVDEWFWYMSPLACSIINLFNIASTSHTLIVCMSEIFMYYIHQLPIVGTCIL